MGKFMCTTINVNCNIIIDENILDLDRASTNGHAC